MASGSTKPLHHRCGTGLYISNNTFNRRRLEMRKFRTGKTDQQLLKILQFTKNICRKAKRTTCNRDWDRYNKLKSETQHQMISYKIQ
jgi:hypothetical protein